MPPPSVRSAPAVRLAVVGAGPRAVGFLERLAASLPDIAPDAPLEIELIDPYAPGAGRIWRYAQSPLLKLNSMAQDVTMFTDASSTIDGPVRNGPSLIEWAVAVRGGLLPEVTVRDPRLRAELEHLLPTSFPTRRLQSLYLDWFYRRAVEALGTAVRLRVHRASVLRVEDIQDAEDSVHPQRVLLDSGESIEADVVLYAIGHAGRDPEDEHTRLIDFARRRELYYLPPAFTADADTRPIVPGQRVIVRGFGLAAVDVIVLLTEGRGGRFERDPAGRLRYEASGREPRLVIGSRRGVPYHSKIASTLRAPRPEPRYFTPEIARELATERGALDFRDDVWPLIAKEMLWGHYNELFLGHPDCVSVPWESFRLILDREAWDSPILRTAIDHGVADPLDRLHLAEFDRPLAGRRFADPAELQEAVRAYIRNDLAQRTAPEHSASLGQFLALLGALFTLLEILDAPVWTERSRLYELPRAWPNYFSFVASGPPAHRLEEILALSEVGLVEFLGGEIDVQADEVDGVFIASGANSAHTVRASALIDARLPDSSAGFSDNAALRALIADGTGVEERVRGALLSGSTGRLLVRPADTSIVRPDGSAHPHRYAIGPYTTSPFAGAFSRPGTNAIAFRENDSTARAILLRLRDIAQGRGLNNTDRTLIGTRTP